VITSTRSGDLRQAGRVRVKTLPILLRRVKPMKLAMPGLKEGAAYSAQEYKQFGFLDEVKIEVVVLTYSTEYGWQYF
jgi:hypothetical protein